MSGRSGMIEALTNPEPPSRTAQYAERLNALIDDYRFRRLSMREFVRRAYALGVSAPVIGALVSIPPLPVGHPLRQMNNPVELPGETEPAFYARLARDEGLVPATKADEIAHEYAPCRDCQCVDGNHDESCMTGEVD